MARIGKRRIARQRLCHHLSQERPLFRRDEFVFLGEIEIRDAFAVELRALEQIELVADETVTDIGGLRDFRTGTM
ncbi:MAG: hypothetical protein KGL62_04700 [Bradyrhizobium sp.]|uniref:hypothetical protein n=1 Tax=Bradyrhizobium sp. TaxID=376 RepID=UPI0023995A1A|nr:hypothetical protein [Bradyrhizobium sp.]MDE2601653.1 hypothetical protein [Bradyrhizobium sp.]